MREPRLRAVHPAVRRGVRHHHLVTHFAVKDAADNRQQGPPVRFARHGARHDQFAAREGRRPERHAPDQRHAAERRRHRARRAGHPRPQAVIHRLAAHRQHRIFKHRAAGIQFGELADRERRNALPVAVRRAGRHDHPVFCRPLGHRAGLQHQGRPHSLRRHMTRHHQLPVRHLFRGPYIRAHGLCRVGMVLDLRYPAEQHAALSAAAQHDPRGVLGCVARRRPAGQDRRLPVHVDTCPVDPGELQRLVRLRLEPGFQPCGTLGGLVHAPPRDKGQGEERNETRQVVKQAHDVADLL